MFIDYICINNNRVYFLRTIKDYEDADKIYICETERELTLSDLFTFSVKNKGVSFIHKQSLNINKMTLNRKIFNRFV